MCNTGNQHVQGIKHEAAEFAVLPRSSAFSSALAQDWPLDIRLPRLAVPRLAGLLVNRPPHAHDSGVAYINHPGAGYYSVGGQSNQPVGCRCRCAASIKGSSSRCC